MKLYNTLTRKKEKFTPLSPHSAGLYSCGPTVYDYTHIGHARTYVFVDVLKRTLNYLGYKVDHVMNITDVGHLTGDNLGDTDTGEDKIEKKAKAEGKTAWEISQFYTDYFFDFLKKLGIEKANTICKATDYISQMIKLIGQLEKKGFIYKISDGIYFDTSKLKDYGKLARLKIEDLKEGARVKINPEKKNPTDFALWKFSYPTRGSFSRQKLRILADQDDGMGREEVKIKRQMEWDSPWGVGFPGWHIECSAMSMEHLGETIDIHTGGIDHIPVHHTNEIAQSEGATGKPFVKYWLHAGHLLVEGEKMSKSLGNFYRIEDIQKKGFDPLALRYLFLTAHYRAEMNFEWQALEGARSALNKLRAKFSIFPDWLLARRDPEQADACRDNFQFSRKENKYEKKNPKIVSYKNRFKEYISDDLNMPKAIALVWEVIKSGLPDVEKKRLILDWDKVLGLNLKESGIWNLESGISEEIKELVGKREKLRKEKKWEEADEIRKEIEKKGYLIEDKQGESIIRKKPKHDL